MKKGFKRLLYLIILFLGFTVSVRAISMPSNPIVHKFGKLSNSQYKISTTKSAYCMSPNKPHGSTYNIEENVNPSKSYYNLALTIAYTRFVKDGIIKSNSQSGGIISATFRLISEYYGKLEHTAAKNPDGTTYAGGDDHEYYLLKKNSAGIKINLLHSGAWTGTKAKYAYKVFKETILLIKNTSGNTVSKKYNNLINSNSLFKTTSFTFNAKVNSVTTVGNKKDVTFTVTTNAPGINWNKFAKSTNCESLTNKGNGVFVARIANTTTSFKITGTYNTIMNSGTSRIYIITANKNYQRMILVNSATKTINPSVTVTVGSTPTPPPSPPPVQHSACSIEKNPTTGAKVYYGTSKTVVDVNTYRAQCVHNCQNYNGTYYCKNNDLDYSGPVCSYEQWEKQCTYCGINRDVCTANPNNPACPKDYWQNCPICNPSINLPDSCNDFDTNSELKGTINDLNPTKSSCNPSEYPVKACVIGGKDIAGNSYEMVEALKNNRYCRAYCIEDYQFDIPTARYSTSGGYFDLSMKIVGTRNCYLGPPRSTPKTDASVSSEIIDYNKFKNDVNTYSNNIANYYAAKNYSMALNLSNELNKMISEYKDCTTIANKWVNNFKFDPKIDYTYNDYVDKYDEGTFSKINDTETTEITNTYCYGTTDSKYNCNGNKIVTNQDVPLEASAYDNFSYYNCTGTSSNATCTLKQDKINKAIGVQKTVTKSAMFAPGQSFSTYHQYGTIKTGNLCENANVTGYKNCLWTRLPDSALPVELKTGKGAFPFTLKFRDVGQYGNDSLGRLIGDDNSVLNEFNDLSESKKCLVNDGSSKSYSTFVQDVGYVCSYINNCDECGVSCEGDSCILKECEDCKVSCRTCIFDGQNTTYKYRSISLNNVFPNKCDENSLENSECREEGYNWNVKSPNSVEKNKKAEKTISEIESLGEGVYEEANKEYSYTLNPAQLNAIRHFNQKAGTYANTQMPYIDYFKENENSLQCEQVNYNGIQYSVRCISTFLNDTSGTYFTSNLQRSDTTKFTLWTETDNCINGNCLSRVDGIGPSWK